MLSHDLLNILVCPVCKGKLNVNDNKLSLHCRACNLTFPVREGIPVILVNEVVAR